MKKSEQYTLAMASVIRDARLSMDETLDILETLMDDRKVARYSEKREEPVKAAGDE